jgi:hypothetical protein
MFDLEQILYLLAARGGAMGRSSLEKAIVEFDRQVPSLNNNGRSGLEPLWALDSLGHCETAGRKGRIIVKVARASLARLPGIDKSRAVLTGARSASTEAEIQEACKASKSGVSVLVSEAVASPTNMSIKRVLLESDSDSFVAIQSIAHSVGIPLTPQPAGWELACASTSVVDFQNGIQWVSGYPVPDEAEHFSPDTLRFGENYSGGLRLARWKESAINKFIYALRNDSAVAFLDSPEWGRHVELCVSGASSIRYDAGRKIFGIRATARPPRLLARALCLCSGTLPAIAEAGTGKSKALWLAYEDVPQPVANIVAEKLGQEVGPLPF